MEAINVDPAIAAQHDPDLIAKYGTL